MNTGEIPYSTLVSSPGPSTTLTVVVDPDQQAFSALTNKVSELNGGISVDSGEWGAFAGYGANATSIHDYTQQCQGLWTDGEDQSSWATVKQAAMQAGGAVRVGGAEAEVPAAGGGEPSRWPAYGPS